MCMQFFYKHLSDPHLALNLNTTFIARKHSINSKFFDLTDCITKTLNFSIIDYGQLLKKDFEAQKEEIQLLNIQILSFIEENRGLMQQVI